MITFDKEADTHRSDNPAWGISEGFVEVPFELYLQG